MSKNDEKLMGVVKGLRAYAKRSPEPYAQWADIIEASMKEWELVAEAIDTPYGVGWKWTKLEPSAPGTKLYALAKRKEI